MPLPVTGRPVLDDVVDEALGRHFRDDPVTPRWGGPAGNARLTAWVGLVLLVLLAVELVTVLDVRGMISWHVAVGAALVPVAALKTASTSWRVLRYYTGHRAFREAGPPPTLLRLLGPLVVLTTWLLLGTGVALIIAGPSSGRSPFVTVLGQGLDLLTLHQASFIAFGVVTGVHILARLVPAFRLTLARRTAPGAPVPGAVARWAGVAVAAVAACVLAVVLVRSEGTWGQDRGGDRHDGMTAVHTLSR